MKDNRREAKAPQKRSLSALRCLFEEHGEKAAELLMRPPKHHVSEVRVASVCAERHSRQYGRQLDGSVTVVVGRRG